MNKLLIVFLLFLYSCTYGGATMLTDAKYPAKPNDYNVQLLLEEPTKPHKKIAIVDAVGDMGIETLEDLMKTIKKKCREIGADAVILGKYSESSGGTTMLVPVGTSLSIISTSGRKPRIIGYAIVWEESGK